MPSNVLASEATPGPYRVRKVTPEERRGRGSAPLKEAEWVVEPSKPYPKAKGARFGPPAFTIAIIPFRSGCAMDTEYGPIVPGTEREVTTRMGDGAANAYLLGASWELRELLAQLVKEAEASEADAPGDGSRSVDAATVESAVLLLKRLGRSTTDDVCADDECPEMGEHAAHAAPPRSRASRAGPSEEGSP